MQGICAESGSITFRWTRDQRRLPKRVYFKIVFKLQQPFKVFQIIFLLNYKQCQIIKFNLVNVHRSLSSRTNFFTNFIFCVTIFFTRAFSAEKNIFRKKNGTSHGNQKILASYLYSDKIRRQVCCRSWWNNSVTPQLNNNRQINIF